jgi:general nucleoside transport system ATP-binding protein
MKLPASSIDIGKDVILETVGLTKRFSQVLANDHISLTIRKGEIHCLLGENGAGKSTLAECLYGYYQPDEGQILFKGEPTLSTSPQDAIRLGIGMVHQRFSLVEPFSVLENIQLADRSTGLFLGQHRSEERLRSLCETYGVCLDPRMPIWQLSVGEQQWVEILKTLYVGAELLILDEPTEVLTPQETDRLFAVLQKMKSEGLSIIFITHKLPEVMKVSDRVTVLRKGKLVDTVDTADVTMTGLAKMMVGREVVFRVGRGATPIGEPIMELRDLRANNDLGREGLRGISLTLHSGEILGLAGVAGNGQKELFEALVGVRATTGGQILVGGDNLAGLTPAQIMNKGVGHIPEDRICQGLIMEFTVADNLILGQQWSRQFQSRLFLDREKIRAYSRDCIATFEIATPSPDQPTRCLSGGNLQKVILARELRQQPRILLANQPTRGLDVGIVEYVHRTLLAKRQEGAGILFSSEDLDEILGLSDRIAVIYRGQIAAVLPALEARVEDIGLLMAGTRSAP